MVFLSQFYQMPRKYGKINHYHFFTRSFQFIIRNHSPLRSYTSYAVVTLRKKPVHNTAATQLFWMVRQTRYGRALQRAVPNVKII